MSDAYRQLALSERELEMAENALRALVATLDAVHAAGGATEATKVARGELVALVSKLFRAGGGKGGVF